MLIARMPLLSVHRLSYMFYNLYIEEVNYIMSNKNNKVIYIGVTNDIARRIYEHKAGIIEGFTKKYNVHKSVYFETFGDIKAAIARENS